MDLISMPERPDNAENSVKCHQCGNTILVGSEDGTGQDHVTCDICHRTQKINPDGVHGSSNEDY